MGYLTPETTTPTRPIGTDAETLEVRSYLLMRMVVGILGIALPVILIVGDILFLETAVSARGSLSAYYHSGMRDIFVGVLVVVGIFLVTYKIFRRSLDNTLSIIAGLAAIGVALFPTGIPDDVVARLTPLQRRLGEDTVSTIHFVAAAIFIVLLGVMSYFFAVREGARRQDRDGHHARFSPRFWRRFHLTAAGVIAAAILFIVITKVFDFWEAHSLLIGEIAAVWAFGASWLAKGFELNVFRGTRWAPAAAPAPVTATGA